MSFIGLDLGTAALKVVSILPMGSNFGVDAIGAVPNPTGSVNLVDPTVKQRVGESLKKLLSDMGLRERRVVVGIPESQVFSRVIGLPIMSDAELASAIGWEAEQFVPVPIEEVEMDFSVVKRPPAGSAETTMLVYLIASPKKYLKGVVDFLSGLGLEPIAIESEMVAAARALSFGVAVTGTTLVVHMGAQSTVLGIVEGDVLLFSYVVPIGGVALTRSLAQTLAFPLPQAEEYKRTYGLSPTQFEGKVRQALMIAFGQVITEIHKAIEYHATEHKTSINRVQLSGGGAYLPELSSYLSGEFPGIEIVIADPFVRAKMASKVQLPLDRASYTVAVGLGLRTF
jgi:type IV pilus assembly protein PilM